MCVRKNPFYFPLFLKLFKSFSLFTSKHRKTDRKIFIFCLCLVPFLFHFFFIQHFSLLSLSSLMSLFTFFSFHLFVHLFLLFSPFLLSLFSILAFSLSQCFSFSPSVPHVSLSHFFSSAVFCVFPFCFNSFFFFTFCSWSLCFHASSPFLLHLRLFFCIKKNQHFSVVNFSRWNCPFFYLLFCPSLSHFALLPTLSLSSYSSRISWSPSPFLCLHRLLLDLLFSSPPLSWTHFGMFWKSPCVSWFVISFCISLLEKNIWHQNCPNGSISFVPLYIFIVLLFSLCSVCAICCFSFFSSFVNVFSFFF